MSAGSFTLNCSTPNNFYDSGGNGGGYLDSQNITSTFTSNTPGQCITVTFNSFNTEGGFDYLRIYDGTSASALQIGQLSGNPTTPVSFTSSTGSLTFVFTSDGSITYAGWSATFACTTACFTPPPTPVNDDPCNAISLTVDTDCNFQEYTNLNATASPGIPAPGCASYQGADVWFSLVVPASGAVVIDSDTGEIYDSGMALYTGSCSSLTLLSCNDDGSMNGAMSMIQATGLTPGSTVYVRMWSFSNSIQGTFSICAHEVPPLTDGDICDFALPFCTGSNYVFPNNTNQPGFGSIDCLGSSPNPVWYYMQIENSGALNIGISQVSDLGNPIDVDFDLWGPFNTLAEGCSQVNAGTAVSVDCSFSISATEEANIPNAIAGQYYILLLTNYNGSSGTISFNSLSSSTASTNCAIVCGIEALNYSVSSCDAVTNTYELTGTIDLLDPPTTGVLVVSSSCGATSTISQPWPSTVPFTLSSLPANGGSCDIEVYFSDDPTCSYSQTYIAPNACSSVSLNCPEYANTSNSLNEGCGSQTYYLNVENTFCDGTIEFDIQGNYGSSWAEEISWDLVSVQTGNVIASGGPGTNGTNVNIHIGPLSAQTYGNIFSFNVYDAFGDGFNGTGGYFQVIQNGNLLAGPYFGDFGFQAGTIFGVNIAISSASISVNTPNGIVQNTVQNCQDFNIPIYLENTNYCTPINVNLPWEITCTSTGSVLASGTQSVLINPTVPHSYEDVVEINFNSTTCGWEVNFQNDCDQFDLNSIFTISPPPNSLAPATCSEGVQSFTVEYFGASSSLECCETAGPLAPFEVEQSFSNSNISSVSSPFGGINNSALIQTNPANFGGNATDLSLNISINNFCFNPPSTQTNTSYWTTVIVDGFIIYDGQTANPAPLNQTLSFDLADLPNGFNQNSVVQVYVYPNSFNSAGIYTTYVNGANCGSLADGVWTATFSAEIEATFQELYPTEGICEFTVDIPFDCCNPVTVPNQLEEVCFGSAMTLLDDWQNAVEAANSDCIYYSSVTPIAGSVVPDNQFPDGSGNATSFTSQSVGAYYYCDTNGSGTVNTGDSYILVSSYTINIYPENNAAIDYVGSPFCIDYSGSALPTILGTTGGTFSAAPGGLSINAATGAVTPSASTPGTYTITYSIAATGPCPAYSTSTSLVVTGLPADPTLLPIDPCEEEPVTFTAGNGNYFEFFVNGVSQLGPSSTADFSTSDLQEGDEVCVRSYPLPPFVMQGLINEPEWGTPLATSAGGPASSGFGGNNRIDALYLKNYSGKLYGAIAGNENDGNDQMNNNWILMFIDSKPGGFNNLQAWTNRTNVPSNTSGILNLALYQNIVFDAGFQADYILTMNQAGTVAYFDLYDMVADQSTYLGSNVSDPANFGFTGNLSTGDYSRGFEFSFPLASIGSPAASLSAFVMMVNDPNAGAQTFLSNQFLSAAGSGQGNFADGYVDFNNEPPSPISFLLSADCYSETCVTVVEPQEPTFNQIPPICYGETGVVLPTTSLEGITGSWSPAINYLNTTTYTFEPDPGQCADEVEMTIEVLPLTTTTPIYHD